VPWGQVPMGGNRLSVKIMLKQRGEIERHR
jgi:hypothetical protein